MLDSEIMLDLINDAPRYIDFNTEVTDPIYADLEKWPNPRTDMAIQALAPINSATNLSLPDLIKLHSRSSRKEIDFTKLEPREQLAVLQQTATQSIRFPDFIGPLLDLFENNNPAKDGSTKAVNKAELLDAIKNLGRQLKGFSIQQTIHRLASDLTTKFKNAFLEKNLLRQDEFDEALTEGYLEKTPVYL